jgi:uncharacterized Fe-S cluster protein YjdI/CDGSH-type Zn-finger protein
MVNRSYAAEGIVVHWNSELCIHTAICLNTLPAVFDVQARPWIDADAAAPDEVASAIERCPTGALTYERTDGAPNEVAPEETTIIPWPNGPLMVRGNVEIRDAKGELFTAGPRFTLCRCGASTNQPFCDLSHRRVGFLNNPHIAAPDRDDAESPEDIDPKIGP